MEIKFRDDDGVIFGTADIIKLLGERTDAVMKKWGEEQVEFKKEQDRVVKRAWGLSVKRTPKADNADDGMVI